MNYRIITKYTIWLENSFISWITFYLKFNFLSWAPVAHTCNPSYSGDRDQEEYGLKPALGKQFKRPYLKKYPMKKF
jgi:hypothetical protein